MARLKFGSFEVQAEMPQVAPPSGLDVKSIIDNAIAMLPKSEAAPLQKEVDLSLVYKEIEILKTDIFLKVNERNDLVNDHVFMLIDHHERLNVLESESKVELPEVKHITHVKDVSPEVIKTCERMGLRIEDKYDRIVAELETHNKKQKLINYILSGGIVLSILIHLL